MTATAEQRVVDLSQDILDILLQDKTSKKHIIWGTNNYQHYGRGYSASDEIFPELISGANSYIIQPRATKSLEEQTLRTKVHAEVMTPAWMICLMVDACDDEWFGEKNLFHVLGESTWEVVPEAIPFNSDADWKKYIDSRRLEITCGEAPYITTRYDASTGDPIPVMQRVGILDRKLRVVGENTENFEEWTKWAVRAVQAVYGYEYQGDNLVIARINVLMTFVEHMMERWNVFPNKKQLKSVANIVAWNFWQMNGYTDAVPLVDGEAVPGLETAQQLSLFGEEEPWYDSETSDENACSIRNWRSDCSLLYKNLKEGKRRDMQIDFLIGNPPFQDETVGEQKTYAPPVYHLFLDEAYKVSKRVTMIHPARFLFNAGSTPKKWNEKMLNDEHLKILYYEANSSNVFPNTSINGGIVVTYRDTTKNFGAIRTFTSFPALNSILNKVIQHPKFESFSEIVVSRTSYRLTDILHRDYPEAITRLSKGHAYDMSTNIFSLLPDVFYDSAPDDGKEYIRIFGRENNTRTYKYIRRDYVNTVCNLDKYKLFLSKADGAAGQLGSPVPARIIGKSQLSEPGVGSTESFISIGIFDTEDELLAADKYIKTRFARTMLGVLKTTQDITPQKWEYVPMQDFTAQSDIDWNVPISAIDQQLYRKYGLSEEEIAFVEEYVKETEE